MHVAIILDSLNKYKIYIEKETRDKHKDFNCIYFKSLIFYIK